jgi:hypothetical protein
MKTLLGLVLIIIGSGLLYILVERGTIIGTLGYFTTALIIVPCYFVVMWLSNRTERSGDSD